MRIEFFVPGDPATKKRADRSGAQVALIMGENEVRTGAVAVKDLREPSPQHSLMQSDLGDYLVGRMISDPQESRNQQ